MSERLNNGEKAKEKLKETILDKAREGVFDHNPLLSTIHSVTCEKCGRRLNIVYLDYLKSGEFEVGRAEQVEVLTTQGPVGWSDMERVRPIIISLTCEGCNCLIEARPVSIEYLMVIIDRPKTSGTMYA